MLLSLKWMREFTPYEGEVDVLADRLTMLGLEVDEIYHPFRHLEGVVVGHVAECEPHPEADKLSVCTVDTGSETLSIVCGAPNVAKGQKVAVAPVGTELPGGLKIKKAKLRGVASHGMICSERELELSDEHEGIMVLPDTLAPGTGLIEALDLETTVLDIDLTPNRGDCLSMLGLARETAMAFDLPLSMPSWNLTEGGGDAREMVEIEIPEPELCPLYQARIVRNITIAKSPDWMRHRLLAIGVRPISNVVDVTNYVMMEMGQPLHAFDMDLLEGGRIVVESAEEGMRFTTLDGQERVLESSDLLIKDGTKPVALAGVMGGENTEIHSGSKNLLLECAVFRPATIRRTARRLALPSESSHRFERGVDQQASKWAVDRAAALVNELAGGEVQKNVSFSEPRTWKQPRLTFRPSRASAVVGLDFDDDFCAGSLSRLGCEVDSSSAPWSVLAPSHRPDLEREIDLVEEVARVYGLDRIPTTLPRVARVMEGAQKQGVYDFTVGIKRWARGAGLSECINYSFVGDADLDAMGLPEEGRVHIANPLSEDQSVMRTSVPAGLLQSLKTNLSHSNVHLRLFEVAKTFHADPESDTETRENERFCMLLHGRRHSRLHPWGAEISDYTDVKGLIEDLLAALNIDEADFSLAKDHPWLSPCVSVAAGGGELGVAGRVREDLADSCKARHPVWMADLDMEALMRLSSRAEVEFCELPKFPPVRRDVTFVCPPTLNVAEILAAVRGTGQKLLADVEQVNEFTPESGETRNLSFRLTYRSPSKTLKDKEVDKVHAQVVEAVTRALPVTLQ